MLDLTDIGRYWARIRPDGIGLTFEGRSFTWAELDRASDELAAGLAELGVRPGDRVGLLMHNRPEWCDVTMAALKLGAIVVPVNVRFTASELAYVVADADCRLVVSESAFADVLSGVADRRVLLADELDQHRRTGERPTIPDERGGISPAFICYTSGTTGDPKGAVLTHASWNAGSQGWAQAMALGPDTNTLLPFPLAFTGGLAVWLFTYWAGGRVVLERAFEPTRALELIEAERITGLFAVPAIYQALVAHPRWGDTDLSSWRVASSGGAAVPEALIRAVQARGVPMAQGFSLTEASAAGTVLPPRDALGKLGSAGLAVLHGTISVVDPDGPDDTPLPPGEVGEILVGGPQIMAGYWNRPDASAEALRGGHLHTGDLGHLDQDGYLYVVDRMKDMLISGGLNVYPAEIERALGALPGATELTVIGVPDERWGETPAVIAVGDAATVTGDAVLAALGDDLADFKLPRYVIVRDEPLPRGMSGKVLKRELVETYRDLATTETPIR
ncbi:MAG: AMP-binding protein [Actinomycetota bacterium]